MNFLKYLKNLKIALNNLVSLPVQTQKQMLLLGKFMAEMNKAKQQIQLLSEVEFTVFSQWGDDGIIQWLVNSLNFPHNTFIEFGVENYRESNTRFLLMNNNWQGLVMDGSEENVSQIIHSEYYNKYSLTAKAKFITAENINDLITAEQFHQNLGILHIDIDGNDYWIWKAITVITPIVVIVEYNSILGTERAITIPYAENFNRTEAHYSNLYWGASIVAFNHLAEEKGYAFIGCNSAGNNAYFVRKDKLNERVRAITIENGFVLSRFRESRNAAGDLSYLSGDERIEAIRSMPFYNVINDKIETL